MNWSDTVDDEKWRCSDSTLRQDVIALAARLMPLLSTSTYLFVWELVFVHEIQLL